ncbi:hypothetical protein [Rhodococcoides navarretei]|uniref:Uncharacterized protein n=1 Tax=Rhodococcus navarretei TaxID=3128981 RepID=A0ABU9CTD5_9NOCA
MARCGQSSPLSEPDVVGMMERYGRAEHFVIQVDFCAQPWRAPQVEFSIPDASKTGRLWNTLDALLSNITFALNRLTKKVSDPKLDRPVGFADIVDTHLHAIWEIKPKKFIGKGTPPAVDYDTRASKEAEWYAHHANRHCLSVIAWHPGMNYYPLRRTIDGSSVVFEFRRPDKPVATLIADQYLPGAVLYHWEIDDKEDPDYVFSYSWALRSLVIERYFPRGMPKYAYLPDPAPFDIPMPIFTVPELSSTGIVAPLNGFVDGISAAMKTLCAGRIVAGAAVTMLLDESTYARVMSTPSAQSQTLQQQTLSELQIAALIGAVVIVAIVIVFAPVAAPAAAAVFAAAETLVTSLVTVKVVSYAVAGAVVGLVLLTSTDAEAKPIRQGPIGSLNRALAQSGKQLGPITDGTTIFTLLVPRAGPSTGTAPAEASNSKLATLEPVLPKYELLTPLEALSIRLGQSKTIDGKKYVVVAIAR